ncbi:MULTISPECIES: hypothetical protein [unclassified Adlercreutzia]|uniref:hypothetical protein n=1 Tax=unclassified Adlercreutzia TaxID=2636013 RepID=UPI0013ED1F5F|nr:MULTISPECIES: hypothetical protein [unclassified Adlercreutzia]
MDKFKMISSITKEILGSSELESKFAEEPMEVLAALLPGDYEGSEEEKAELLRGIEARVVMWTRNTGVASSVQ